MIAAACAVAFIVFSCKGKLSEAEKLDLKETPVQTVEDGVLETYLQSDNAKHYSKKRTNEEKWSAFGHVVVQNIIKQETMETDTLYWDRGKKEIFTDCYVRLFSNDGFMQGYGMRSDEMARDVVLYKPFNSFAVVVQDTTKVIIDSVNFVGPLLKK